MEIEEVKRKKKIMEECLTAHVQRTVRAFEKETGVEVDSVIAIAPATREISAKLKLEV